MNWYLKVNGKLYNLFTSFNKAKRVMEMLVAQRNDDRDIYTIGRYSDGSYHLYNANGNAFRIGYVPKVKNYS